MMGVDEAHPFSSPVAMCLPSLEPLLSPALPVPFPQKPRAWSHCCSQMLLHIGVGMIHGSGSESKLGIPALTLVFTNLLAYILLQFEPKSPIAMTSWAGPLHSELMNAEPLLRLASPALAAVKRTEVCGGKRLSVAIATNDA